MPTDQLKEIKEQYDKIYRYCYFKLQKREIAEDITQETFLRFLESENYHNEGKALRYLYAIARNLCIDEYRKKQYQVRSEEFDDERDAGKPAWRTVTASGQEEEWITAITVREALKELKEEERELVLLRYVNEVPVSVICSLYQLSRFSVYRKLKRILKSLEEKLGEPQRGAERNASGGEEEGGGK
ncbi:MAG: RNA polymerase sigma factor [Lachnospiraceae bacterium]|nr:RNA polymerase sigma factor [Lachnospiraceae bacterium]